MTGKDQHLGSGKDSVFHVAEAVCFDTPVVHILVVNKHQSTHPTWILYAAFINGSHANHRALSELLEARSSSGTCSNFVLLRLQVMPKRSLE